MIYLNLGRRETGKTTLACYLVQKAGTRIVFDPRGLFPSDKRAATPDEVDGGFALIRSGRLAELVITPDSEMQGCFDAACEGVKVLLRSGRTDLAFVVDELRFVQDVTGADLNWILRCATRDSIIVVFTAHRPKDVSVDIRAISDVWCLFQTTQENDLKIVAERCSPLVADKVQRLAPRHFVSWDDARGQMAEHAHPERWHVPLRPASAAMISTSQLDELRGDVSGATNRGRLNFADDD